MTLRLIVAGVAMAGITGGPALADDRLTRAAVLFDGHLVVVDDDGRADAWPVATGRHSKEWSARLTRKGLVALAADGPSVWATDGRTLYRWAADPPGWERAAGFNEGEGSVPVLVVAGGVPLVVLPSRVIDPLGCRTFPVPKLKGYAELLGWPPRVLAVHASQTMVWIGSGKGEWGGALYGLDPKSRNWVFHADPGGYATGITHVTGDEVVVSWAMSHLREVTHVSVHGPDARPRREHKALDGKYYQAVAYSRFDDTVYGVEADTLVTIRDGEPTVLGKIGGRVYGDEPNAMGVAPGVRAVVPLAKGVVAVVPKWGDPWVYRAGVLARLTQP